jgi:very-short-patch-repair endonuclease
VDPSTALAPDITQRIERTRRELLDLSARNRLISTPRGATRGRRIDIVDERSDEVFRLLVRERKAMSFLPGIEDETTKSDETQAVPSLPQPEDEPGATPDPRHTDSRLQTRLGSERLQRRLLDMYYDARTFEEEQGVSILYLAMGFLKWFEAPASDKARYAPLLLIPVDLERPSAASRFHLRCREEDVTTNLSLQAKLKAEFGIGLPDVPEMDEITPTEYFDAVALAVADQPRWEVERNDLVVWFFSFAKYLMYRDLDPATWPAHSPLAGNATLVKLLGDGFVSEPALCGESDKIDLLIPPARMVHITDADSSQAVVIEEVRLGRHLVVQGPPGTGKSQTITNLIATAVNEGKKVLFVAEKMAALEVVQSRLERLGLGAICLELHSHKANKKTILQELAKTLALGRPKAQLDQERIESLEQAILRLNRHAELMNTPLGPAGLTPFEIIGGVYRLGGAAVEATSVALTGPESWTASQVRERRAELEVLQGLLRELGSPRVHPWRGVTRLDPILPADLHHLLSKGAAITSTLAAVRDAAEQLAQTFGLPGESAATLKGVQQLGQLARRIEAAPELDRSQVANAAWTASRDAIAELVQRGQSLASAHRSLQGKIAETAWQTDMAATRRSLAAHGRSLFRWFWRDYRAAVAALRGIVTVDLPATLDGRLEIVDALINAQTNSMFLDSTPASTQLGRDAFGLLWKGSTSDWPALAAIVKWDAECRDAGLPWDHRAVLARLPQPAACEAPMKVLRAQLEPAYGLLQEVCRTLALDCSQAFELDSLDSVPIVDLIARLQGWKEHPEQLSQWINYQRRKRSLEQLGLAPIIAELHEGRVPAEAAVDLFQLAYYQALAAHVFRQHPEIAGFDGQSHEHWIEAFRSLDHARIEMARGEVATAHYEAIPRSTVGGEMRVVRSEIEKKRRHKPIRQLIKDAGTAILGIKPVFMMSPISVALYLEPGSVTFDLLLIDEASQVKPEDALGAMARAKQIVVVGDDKQLPPTRFFNKMLDDGGSPGDPDDDVHVGDLESVLGLCVTQGMSQRMLRWHYRSRHHSLIAVSNREFYANNLYVIPSPTTITAMHGLHFRLVKDGVFDRGNTATNRVEARSIAEAVIAHATKYPAKSLGVGAFSVPQRDAIRDELEVLLRQHPETAAYFAPGRPEPFFIKNLENIQGDERDVIFISVGYARDASGDMTMNFGPLSTEGGERRLNVLISRARERCEVFSSITADDIDLQRARSRGAASFKTFLRYAATGVLDTGAPAGLASDSAFESAVARALEQRGYEVHCQVGTSGFVIDLAVVDSDRPGRYLLGIECDGESYHRSRSARDRDRLRDKVLLDRGWRIHRIWSTDWFHRPEEQLQKIIAAIDEARSATDIDEQSEAEMPADPVEEILPETDVERSEQLPETNGEVGGSWVTAYVEALLAVPTETPIHETSPAVLSEIVARVVEVEGPIHREEIARRITSLWGHERTGVRIAEATRRAIDSSVHAGHLRAEGDFIAPSQQAVPPVRCRADVASANLKRPEMLPPSELRRAIQCLVEEHVGIRRDEVPPMLARVLGFKSTSPKLKETIEGVLGKLLEANTVLLRDEKLFLP